MNLFELSATDLVLAYGNKTLSPVEVTQAVLGRMSECEPKINAMYLIRREAALVQAAASEQRWRAGTPLSPLDGVPITLKENIVSAGDPAPLGSAAGDITPKPTDSPPAARVREAGCVMLGKTTMPDYGMLSSGVSSFHGVTRNPWRLDRNPSGSSSGAGAACAAGYGPLHLGTDIGGSVRLPATHCGIFALKPSHGRVPIYPPYLGRVVGPMTRTVRDAALLMNVLAQPDGRDFMNLPYDSADYVQRLTIDIKGKRIGLLTDMGVGLAVHPEVRAASTTAARALEQDGAIVEEMSSFFTAELLDAVGKFFEIRLYGDFSQLSAERQSKVLPFVAKWCGRRAATMDGREAMLALQGLIALQEAAVHSTLTYDFVISPTSPILPYEAQAACPGDDPANAFPHIAFTVPWNFSQQPAASLNWTHSIDGLPIGVQVIGRRFDDVGVLATCHLLEGLRPTQTPWPLLA